MHNLLIAGIILLLAFITLSSFYGGYRSKVPSPDHLQFSGFSRKTYPNGKEELYLYDMPAAWHEDLFMRFDLAALSRKGILPSVVYYDKSDRPIEETENFAKELKEYKQEHLAVAMNIGSERSRKFTKAAPYAYVREYFFQAKTA